MSFTATPTDGSSTPIPMSSAVPDGTNTPLAVEGGPSKSTGGNSLAPVAVYQYDGYDVTQGTTTDAAVVGDVSGTLSAKLRGLSKIVNDVWDSVNHRLHINVDAGTITANAGTNLNTSALAVESGGNLATIATGSTNTSNNTYAISNAVLSGKMQSNTAQIGGVAPTLDNTSIQAVSMRGKGAGVAGDTALLLDSTGRPLTVVQKTTWTSAYSTTQSAVSTWAGSGDIAVGTYDNLILNINVSAITGTSIQFKVARKDAFSNYATILAATALTGSGSQAISIGPGSGGSGVGSQSSHYIGSIIQVTAVLTGITSVSFTVDLQGR